MAIKRRPRARKALPVLALVTALAVGGGFAIDAGAAPAKQVNARQAVSENWSGYVVQSNTGKSFSSVSGSWVQPKATSSSNTSQGYSAFWVGLGGASQTSQSLEQVGTSADVANGQTTYYAWYELVPSAQVRLNLAIHPGDQMSGRVTVNGTAVTISLSDQTTGKSVNQTLQMSAPNTSSAEWIAEAPAAQSAYGGIQMLPLADFGKVTFTNTSATAGGHSGSIADPGWTVQRVDMASAGASGRFSGRGASFSGLGGVPQQPAAGATAGAVSGNGSSFTVSYTSDAAGTQTSTGGAGLSGGNPGYGYPGPGYGAYPDGHGYYPPGI
jgi:Peptidase A4 family